MNGDSRLREFVTVLAFALLIGLGAGLALRYLHGPQLNYALLGLGALTIIIWRFVGRRFGRR